MWPLFGLAVRTPRLELRYPTDLDALELAGRTGDIHDPAFMPFDTPWSRLPDDERERGTLQHLWLTRAELAAERWTVNLCVVVDGAVVGMQSLRAERFGARRTVDTGSWLHRPLQGRGLGREMRAAVLHLAFAGLGAERATTEAFEGNEPSRRVTVGLGYRPNGEHVSDLDGVARTAHAFVLDRATWEANRRDDVELVGLEPCLPLLGAGGGPGQ